MLRQLQGLAPLAFLYSFEHALVDGRTLRRVGAGIWRIGDAQVVSPNRTQLPCLPYLGRFRAISKLVGDEPFQQFHAVCVGPMAEGQQRVQTGERSSV